jgi:hypothetical protein
MTERSNWALHAFLSRTPPDTRSLLSTFLAEELQQKLNAFPPYAPPAEPTHWHLIERVHWSWLIATLKSSPVLQQRLFLAALPLHLQEALTRALSPIDPAPYITPLALSYLRNVLINTLQPTEGVIPPDFLPPSPLNRLLPLAKRDLVTLIDRLALFDLAAELPQIVETKILKRIYSLLSDDQRIAWREISTAKEPFAFPKLGLDKWDGGAESLQGLLHKRGLTRLGIALASSGDLLWHVAHQLDIGRGTALLKIGRQTHPAPLVEWIAQEVEKQTRTL